MKYSLGHFAIALGIGGILFVAWGLGYSSFLDKSDEVIKLQKQINRTSETTGRLTAARAAISKISADEAILEKYFISEDTLTTFIHDLEVRGLTQKASTTVVSVSTGGSKARPTLLLTLIIRGSFDAVMRTVGVIEYAPYALSIANLSIMRTSDESETDAWRADLNLVVGSAPSIATTL